MMIMIVMLMILAWYALRSTQRRPLKRCFL